MDLSNKTILVTGVAGFIGYHLARALLASAETPVQVVGLDNMNDYYDVRLKEERLRLLCNAAKDSAGEFVFVKGDLADKYLVSNLFVEHKPNLVVNLAAQAGVRYSITNPQAYIESNIVGFINILEACRHSYDGEEKGVEHLVYASSSSVYGNNQKVPYSTEDKADNPISLYAATKKSNELMAHAYSKLYGIPATGLRFFTVYGPLGRPDMAYFSFAEKLSRGEKLQIFNYGKCKRDFTYIDDIVAGVLAVMRKPPEENEEGVPYKLFNIGNSQPENLLDFVNVLQQELVKVGVLTETDGLEGHLQLVPMQPGDVEITYADVVELEREFGFKPQTPLRKGLRKFAQWYGGCYKKIVRDINEEERIG